MVTPQAKLGKCVMEVWLISPTDQRPFRVVDFHFMVVKPEVDQVTICLKSHQKKALDSGIVKTPQSHRRHDPANHIRVGQELFMPAAQYNAPDIRAEWISSQYGFGEVSSESIS